MENHTTSDQKPQVFTEDQVASLNAYQEAGIMHPFTCGTMGCRADLVATTEGWVCPTGCGYTQDWAMNWMADWSWKKMDWRVKHE